MSHVRFKAYVTDKVPEDPAYYASIYTCYNSYSCHDKVGKADLYATRTNPPYKFDRRPQLAYQRTDADFFKIVRDPKGGDFYYILLEEPSSIVTSSSNHGPQFHNAYLGVGANAEAAGRIGFAIADGVWRGRQM